MKSRSYMTRIGLEGALMVLSPVPLLLSLPVGDSLYSPSWRFPLAAISTLLCFVCALTLFRRPAIGKMVGAISALAGYGAIFPLLAASPFFALLGSVCLVYLGTVLLQFDAGITGKLTNHSERCLQRARWGALTVPSVAILSIMFASPANNLALYCAAAAAFTAQGLFLHWAVTTKSWWHSISSLICISTVGLVLQILSAQLFIPLIVILSLGEIVLMPLARDKPFTQEEKWWEALVNHPARILIATFFMLCLFGSVLLSVPAATTKGTISFIDSAFTSVSAVCVTGLIVLDTPNDFTFVGQIFILILIQLGGLGIMSITTVALHAMGRRLSLRHEKLLTSMTDTSHQDLIGSLGVILKFTVIVESLGAVILFFSFYFSGDTPAHAIWRGIFTAISAFCNAGFALQSDSLIPYQANPFVLHTVALLIIFGGMAPATSLLIPKWLAGKAVPIPAKIALVVTTVLLLSGTIFILIFEWNGVLSDLSLVDKCQNAWFQSVTLRTAGFNSVDIVDISGPTLLVMLFFMFVGGSPGGTAGGVKTTAIGILAMTFWANITNQRQIVTQHRRIHVETVYRAVTVVIAGAAIWCLVVIMLEVTQAIASRDLIFEATSALGTVGLSTGATLQLDEIGKVIVMIAMFAGRIGPISLFMLLNDEQAASDTRYPVERVSIT